VFDCYAETGNLLIPAHLRHYSAMRIESTSSGGYVPDFMP
jgi:hypothetical protein